MPPTSAHREPGRRILPLIYAVTLTGILSNSLLAPVIPDILDEFGQPDSAAGLLVAVGSMPGIIIAPVVGILADRLGRRNVLVPGMVVFGVFGIIAATAPNYVTLLLARLGMGFGSAAMINLAVVLIGDYFPDPITRTKIIGRNSSVLTLGLALVPLTSGVVTDLASWRWALAIYSFALVTAVVAWRMLDPGRPASVGTVRDQLSGTGAALRNPVIMTTLISGALLFALVFGVFLTVFPTHLEAEFDLSAGWRGLLIAIPAIPSTFMAFNLGRISTRFGRGATVMACSVSWAAAFALIAVAPVLAVLIVGTLLYGAGEGGLIPSLQDAAVSEAPDEHRGAVVAVWVGAARVGQTAGPLAAGALLAAASTTVALWAGAGLAVVLAVLLALSPIVRGGSGPARGATV